MQENCFLYDFCNHKDCNKAFCQRQYKLNLLYDHALVSEAQRKHVIIRVDADGTDMEEFKQLSEIEKNIVDFVGAGKNLFIHSPQSGCGKTTWSLRLLEAYFNKIWPSSDTDCHGLFISVPRFLLALKDNISTKSEYIAYIKENILQADVVIWDDIGSKLGTNFEIDHLLSLIDGRMIESKANIYTSNLNAAEMYTALGSRLASRVCNASIDIALNGTDKRNLMGGKFN